MIHALRNRATHQRQSVKASFGTLFQKENSVSLNDGQLETLLALLRQSHDLDVASDAYRSLEQAAAHLTKSAKKKRKVLRKKQAAAHDLKSLQEPSSGTAFKNARRCYVCKTHFREVNAHRSQLCLPCANESLDWRDAPLNLTGRRALVTGGRVKIGLATSLRLLRAGAEVHITTRFERDASSVYEAIPDFTQWKGQLHIHRADFRNIPKLVEWIDGLRQGLAFDILINNAAQSTWQSPAYFERLAAGEVNVSHPLSPMAQFTSMLAAFDATREDSWVQRLGEVSAVDMIEAQVVNAMAPFLICNQMRANLTRSPHSPRFIVNVSAVEGQFERSDKPAVHPHTNMAKAALNMLTRTSAADLAQQNIFMVSVDPGWMSQEGKNVKPGFVAPLTPEDCAARLIHPIAQGLAGVPLVGVLLKDFHVVPW
jgi:NAD(P)-dependent dehydrogenase (short-subunit alcohol dehydrogenase family)